MESCDTYYCLTCENIKTYLECKQIQHVKNDVLSHVILLL